MYVSRDWIKQCALSANSIKNIGMQNDYANAKQRIFVTCEWNISTTK